MASTTSKSSSGVACAQWPEGGGWVAVPEPGLGLCRPARCLDLASASGVAERARQLGESARLQSLDGTDAAVNETGRVVQR